MGYSPGMTPPPTRTTGTAPLASSLPPGTCVLRLDARSGPGGWLVCRSPRGVVVARTAAEVPDLLREVAAQSARGHVAAGFVAYEAAPAFDAALTVRPPRDGEPARPPAAWFGFYDAARSGVRPPAARRAAVWSAEPWQFSLSAGAHAAAVARVKEHIAAGDTYQVNLTLRLRSRLRGDPWAFFLALQRRQRSGYGAFIDTGEDVVVSASPELFFRLDGERIVARPMKGTAVRGRDAAHDRRLAARLRASAKERAENVMIVDLMRNDLGRIARLGSVVVERLLAVERYPTVLQMTSTVAARTGASLPDLFAALFPCASVTGAPKPSTMGIIAELEPTPRGVYTGAVGCVLPGRRAQFNVAIRTVHVIAATGAAEYGVGGGIVWDSDPAAEFAECLAKAALLSLP
jgi:para-aminobenzoate synthetase / 4-amino-4-deoxychorismate lyase